MSDDSLPASELKRRFHAGGSAKDDQLSASQLRARHGIQTNQGGGGGENTALIVMGLVAVVVIVGVAFKVLTSAGWDQ
eukprot:CAMPEP_0178370448 /NCGR_PEP_ID=MMETSP0689_2-20121128/308_1 /TAXON_ID=160604 /ORGANISM="Amphidinium massartii, Strain CS-259" /LENGTH=77 /DNA_ID=CAMNT_0019990271 /DNA_START=123 /DNA_END=356 /DNA_ORIENTATION=-